MRSFCILSIRSKTVSHRAFYAKPTLTQHISYQPDGTLADLGWTTIT